MRLHHLRLEQYPQLPSSDLDARRFVCSKTQVNWKEQAIVDLLALLSAGKLCPVADHTCLPALQILCLACTHAQIP